MIWLKESILVLLTIKPMTSQSSDNLIPARNYIRQLYERCEYNDKSHTICFEIKNLPNETTKDMFEPIFQYCINIINAESLHRGMKPGLITCTIENPLLTECSIGCYIYRKPNEIDTILNNFMNLSLTVKAQSNGMFWSKPFTLKFNVTIEPEHRKGGKQQLTNVHHQVKKHCLINIDNTDDINLFITMQATMIHTIQKFYRQDFHRYLYSKDKFQGRLRREALQLKAHINASPSDKSMRAYDSTVWIPKIIDFWNKNEGDYKFYAFVFESTGYTSPSFKYGPADYNTPIILYHNTITQHFSGVRKITSLFGKPYCLICEKTYNDHRAHTMKCRARCLKCSKMTYRLLRSCEPILNCRKECLDCNKIFYNNTCYQYHKSIGYCAKSKICRECGEILNIKKEIMKHGCDKEDDESPVKSKKKFNKSYNQESNNESDNEYSNELDEESNNESDNNSNNNTDNESNNESNDEYDYELDNEFNEEQWQ